MVQYPRTARRELMTEIFVAIFPGRIWIIKFNAGRYHISIEGLAYIVRTASLCAVPINPLLYHKTKCDKSKYDIHWLSGYFYTTDSCGTSAMYVNLILRFPNG